jgi:hypothetical protein
MDDALAPPIQRELAALDSITQRVNMQSSYDIHTARLKDAIRTEEVAHRKKRSQEKVRHRAEIDAKNDELRKMGEQARALASLAFAADVKLVSNDLLQTSPQAAEASFTPAKHPLLVGADTVPRAKRRKQCKNDAVARVDPDALFAAATE